MPNINLIVMFGKLVYCLIGGRFGEDGGSTKYLPVIIQDMLIENYL